MFVTEFAFAMKLRTYILLTTTVFLLFGSKNVFAEKQENPLVTAIKMYDQANFSQAEELLKNLIEETPDNLLINYYYGACRTENGKYGEQEISALLEGNSAALPLKSAYYLAVQYHAQNQWDEALQYYTNFRTNSSAAEQDELNLAEKIQQCENHINPFQTTQDTVRKIAPLPRPRDIQPSDSTITNAVTPVYPAPVFPDSIPTDSLPVHHIDTITTQETNPIQPVSKPIDFTINGVMTYNDTSNFQTEEGLQHFKDWVQSKQKLDSLQSLVDSWRENYAKATTNSERTRIGNNIIDAEGDLFALQKTTQNYRTLAIAAENNYWEQQPESAKSGFIQQLNQQAKAILPPEDIGNEIIDTSLILPAATPPTLLKKNTAIESDNADELVYKIQIGAYSRGLPSYVKKLYDKLSYIRKIENYTDDRGVVVYTTGRLTNYDDAVKMQNQVRREGIEDAFVVPYFNGKRITLEEAKKLEQKK